MQDPTPAPFTDTYADFVRWLTTRTLEGRMHWEQHPNGLIAQLTKSTFAQFITNASERGQDWRLFRVHDESGELLRTTPPTACVDTPPLTAAIHALFLTIIWGGPHLIH